MRTVSIISQKGGVGKTTLATALAVAAEADGKNCAVFDLDPQASASFWHDAREAQTPAVAAVPSSRLTHLLKAALESGCDLAIIDAPPFAKDIAFEAAHHADFILIPTRPAVLDIMAMTKTLDLVKHYGKPAAVVLTFCPQPGASSVIPRKPSGSSARNCAPWHRQPDCVLSCPADRAGGAGVRTGRESRRGNPTAIRLYVYTCKRD